MSKFSKADAKQLVYASFQQAAEEIYTANGKDPANASVNAFAGKKVSGFTKSVVASLVESMNADHITNVAGVADQFKQQFVDAIKAGANLQEKEANKPVPHIHLDNTLFSNLQFRVDTTISQTRSSRRVHGVSMIDPDSIREAKETGRGKAVEISGTRREFSSTKYSGSWGKREEEREEKKGANPDVPGK